MQTVKDDAADDKDSGKEAAPVPLFIVGHSVKSRVPPAVVLWFGFSYATDRDPQQARQSIAGRQATAQDVVVRSMLDAEELFERPRRSFCFLVYLSEQSPHVSGQNLRTSGEVPQLAVRLEQAPIGVLSLSVHGGAPNSGVHRPQDFLQ